VTRSAVPPRSEDNSVLRSTRTRLSIMMFLQYAVPATVLPILSHYLKNHLHFEPVQVGQIMAMPATAAILAPFVVTYVADRVISAERLLAACQFIAAGIMLVLSAQTEFWAFLGVYFAYGLVFMPTFALTNTVAFHHVRDAKRDFGRIRMWGPASWVLVGWGFSLVWLRGGGPTGLDSRLPDALKFSALASCALGLYALTLPRSKVKSSLTTGLSFWKSFAAFARPSLLLLCGLTFLNAVVHQFYYYGMSPFMSQIGFADRQIMPAMSMGQFGEVFVLALLGVCLAKIGTKRALIIGVLAQVLRCMAFASGHKALVLAAIPSHGVCYGSFFTVAYIYVDSHSSPESRAGAQQLFNILLAGVGYLVGNLCAGKTAQLLTLSGTTQIDFTRFWLVSAGLALIVAVILILFFQEEYPVQPAGRLVGDVVVPDNP